MKEKHTPNAYSRGRTNQIKCKLDDHTKPWRYMNIQFTLSQLVQKQPSLSGMKTKSLIKLRISFLLKLNTDDLNQQIHYDKHLQKVILRTTEHLFSLNTSKSLLRETITRISKTSHALSKHQNIIYAIEVAYSC